MQFDICVLIILLLLFCSATVSYCHRRWFQPPGITKDNAFEFEKLVAMASKAMPSLFSKRFSIPRLRCAAHAHAQASSEASPLLESVARGLKKKDLHPDRLIPLLDSMPDVNSSVGVFKWASNQRNFLPAAKMYAHMVLKLGMVGEQQEMYLLLKEMVKLECGDMEEAFDYMINCFRVNRRKTEALLVFENACSANRRISISTCNALLGDLVSVEGNLQPVLFVYKEMVKARILPDVETMNWLLQALVQSGWMELALDQFRKMSKKRCEPNSRTFEVVIGGLCSCNRVDEAVEVLNQMTELRCSRDRDFYNDIIPLFCSAGKLEEASELLKMMKDEGFSPESSLYCVLIQSLSENVKVGQAVELFEEMPEFGVARVACLYVDIVDGYCKLGQPNEAANFLRRYSSSEIEPYNAMLKGYCSADRLPEAIVFLENMEREGLCAALSWNIIIRALCEKGEIRGAFEVLGRMITSSYMPDQATYSAVIIGYCRTHAYQDALDKFRLVWGKNMSLDSGSCSEMIEGLCHVNRIPEAVEVFSYMTGKGCIFTPNLLNTLIEGTCRVEKVGEAIRLRSLAYISGVYSNSSTFAIILLKLLEHEKDGNVLALLAQMFVEGCALDAAMYCLLIRGMCAVGATRQAALLFNQMVVGEGLVPDTQTLEIILLFMVKKSCLHVVIQCVDRVIAKDGLFGPAIYNAVICGLLKEGYKSKACKYLDLMLEKGWVPDADAHSLLIGNINLEKGNPVFKASDDDDKLSNILAEGLGSCSACGG